MWRCKKGLEIGRLGGAERFQTGRQSATIALETKKQQLYDVFWKVRDANAQLYDVFPKLRETNIQLYDVFLEPGDAKSLLYSMFLKAREAKSSFYDVFLRVRKAKTAFYIKFLRKTFAGRRFWEAVGTIRDRIGTEINQAGVRSLSGLGLA